MARIKRTPPIETSGRYTLITPFVANPGKIYTCKAIRKFDDIYEQEEDVFAVYYEPHGLTLEIFNEDTETGACIITLVDTDGVFIYVPDTYIESYPLMGSISYSHTVISVDMGALPDYLDLEFTKQQIMNVVTDLVNPPTKVVHVNKAPSVGYVSPTDHEVAEANRVNGIVIRTTDWARVLELEQLVNEQRDVIDRLNQIILDADIIQPAP